MTYQVQGIANSSGEVCEGPHWDVETQSLYYVEIQTGYLLRYDYKEDKVYRAKVEGESFASFIVPIECMAQKFVVGCGRRVVIIAWDGISSTCKVERSLFDVQSEEKYAGNRFNDGKCDPQGRLFAGTMCATGDELKQRLGEFYKYEKGGKVTVVKTDVGISNGLAWNCAKKKFYYVDTTDYDVKEYDYDMKTGTACNPKVILDLRKMGKPEPLLPDGMTIDCDGNLYLATFNGGVIIKFNPCTGKILLEIKLPCKRITSVAFGGPDLDILFVTTSSRFGEPEPAGTLYKITGLCVKGPPMTKVRI